ASENCDGQVLVTEDMLGFFDESAKFVKKYSNIKEVISNAAKKYSSEVKSQKFPTKEYLY
ncbi:MAG: 3-methyl-2-oxobutanoate hydroxymethyltransferase, partial [Rickettsiales bacterium]|nr:3-methyl-2-oxobutanoate hydroxymethyltransferase [Rickettsiales bacterium]